MRQYHPTGERATAPARKFGNLSSYPEYAYDFQSAVFIRRNPWLENVFIHRMHVAIKGSNSNPSAF